MEQVMVALIFEVTYLEDNGCKYAGHLSRQQIVNSKYGNPKFMSAVNLKVSTWAYGGEI